MLATQLLTYPLVQRLYAAQRTDAIICRAGFAFSAEVLRCTVKLHSAKANGYEFARRYFMKR